MLNFFVCFMQNKPVDQSFSGDNVTIIQNEHRSIDLPARISPFLHCERQLVGERFFILIPAVKQHFNVCLTDMKQFASNENKTPKAAIVVADRRLWSVLGLAGVLGMARLYFVSPQLSC